jgi:hypothetical protein
MVSPNFLVTVYQLSYGDYDATTGIPARQYTAASAKIVIQVKGSTPLFNFGSYPKADAIGFTDVGAIKQGDIIVDSFGNIWLVQATNEKTLGNIFDHYEMDLVRLLSLPFTPNSSVGIIGGYDPQYYDSQFYEQYYITP